MECREYGCGCSFTSTDGGMVVVRPCDEHGHFTTVKRAMRMLGEALSEAHEQLPPGPEQVKRAS